jgi:hypothetical protein
MARNFQININEDKTFTSMGGAFLIPGFSGNSVWTASSTKILE